MLIQSAHTFIAVLLLYHAVPHRQLSLAHVLPGALVAMAAFELAKAGFAFYVAHFANYDVVYGSLSGVIALLFWVYLSGNILLFGAKLAATSAVGASAGRAGD
ncbi:MAG: YihY family inner membrane protein [Chloroflexi bacterium]|nr:YihY family inner membrane protein [Chloroflexota bacterium]